MLTLVVANVRAHGRRLATTAAAVAVAVSFLAGTLLFDDAIRRGIVDAFARGDEGIAVAVTGSDRTYADRLVDPAVPDRVRAVPGVAAVDGRVVGGIGLTGHNGQAVHGVPFAAAVSMPADPRFHWVQLVTGRAPSGPEEATLDQDSVTKLGARLGDTLTVVTPAGASRTFTLTGVLDAGLTRRFQGTSVVGFTEPTAQILTGTTRLSEVDAIAAPGVTQPVLRDRVAAALRGVDVRVWTGAAKERADVDDATQRGGEIRTGLLAFVALAVGVAALVIANTFRILQAQRRRDSALLRCVGASRRLLIISSAAEATVLGAAASVIGVFAGTAVAHALQLLLRSAPSPVVATTGTVSISSAALAIGVGVALTVTAALPAAVAASRVPPVEALRTAVDTVASAPATRARILLASALVAAGATGCWVAAAGTGGLVLDMGAALITVVGVIVAGPALVPAAGTAIARAAAATGRLTALLAARALVRSPRRSAATAAAVMVGVSVVSLFSVLAASMDASLHTSIRRHFPADFIVQARQGQQVPSTIAARLTAQPQWAHTYEVRRAEGTTVEGSEQPVTGIPPALFTAMHPTLRAGAAGAFTTGTVAVAAPLADHLRVTVGSTLQLQPPDRPLWAARVVAVFIGDLHTSDIVMPLPDFDARYPHTGDDLVMLAARGSVTPAAARAAIGAVIRTDPVLDYQDVAGYEAALTATVHRLLLIIDGLLVLAGLVAYIGITTSLSLSVLDRTYEIGLLRSLGMQRRSVAGTVTVEGALVALLGALAGVLVGTGIAVATVLALHDPDVDSVHVPVGTLLLVVAGATAAGTVAALAPSRRVARMHPLAALAAT